MPEFGAMVFACLRMLFAGLTMVVFLLLDPSSRQGIREHYKLLTIIGVLTTATHPSRNCTDACATYVDSATVIVSFLGHLW